MTFDSIRSQIIGEGTRIATPYGSRRLTYADWAASGRAYAPIEDYIRSQVLPLYGNTHTETSAVGAQTTAFREGARQVIKDACNCTEDDVVIFAGNGVTGAIHTLIGCLGLRVPCYLKDTYGLTIPDDEKPLVLIGSFEHHSVEVQLKECEVELRVVRECGAGGVDLDHLRELLDVYRAGPYRPLLGCFSAASNVTGRLTDVRAVATLMHEYAGDVFFDYAAAGPYADIDMNAPDGAYVDAAFLSIHKFLGGPGAPGVLIAKRWLFRNRVPAVPGGGTVASVTPTKHAFLTDIEHREEGGTPNIVGSIRAGLAMRLKVSTIVDGWEKGVPNVILAHEQDFARRFIDALRAEPGVTVLGDLDEPRLGIVSFVVHPTLSARVVQPVKEGAIYANSARVDCPSGDGWGPCPEGEVQSVAKCLHHNFVVALLNDLFGVQARGGNSCAAPYAHRLLNVGASEEDLIEAAVAAGWHGCKPGWTRVSFGWADSEDTLRYLIMCVSFIARHGWRFLSDYAFDPKSGTWRHRGGATPVLALGEIGSTEVLPESVRWGYLREAERLASVPRAGVELEPTPFEGLRWFWLPGEVV